jgi:hypothetical protein
MLLVPSFMRRTLSNVIACARGQSRDRNSEVDSSVVATKYLGEGTLPATERVLPVASKNLNDVERILSSGGWMVRT